MLVNRLEGGKKEKKKKGKKKERERFFTWVFSWEGSGTLYGPLQAPKR
jgi:hypothetical protein